MTNVSLIVAGPGKATNDEVSDLLTDYFTKLPEDALVDVYYPMTANLLTPAVEAVLLWADNPEQGGSNVGITEEGKTASRKGKKYFSIADPEPDDQGEADWVFPEFAEVFDLDFGDNEVYFLAAVPKEGEEVDDAVIDSLIELVETAQGKDIKVLDLCAALDDVNLGETAPTPEPEPEPEPPAAPKTRGRRKAAEPVEDPKPELAKEPKYEPPVDGLQEATNLYAQGLQAAKADSDDLTDLSNWGLYRQGALVFLELARRSEPKQPVPDSETPEQPTAQPEAAEPTQEATAAPRRGRGRPRTNPNTELQKWDADEEKWVPRGRGRISAGTKTRTVDLDTGEEVS